MIPPKVKKIHPKDFVKLARMNPRASPIEPTTETLNGPSSSWRRPAITKEIPNTNTAIVKIHEVSARFQPNSFSKGAMKMLQAYSEPRQRFMHRAPTTRHQRLSLLSPLISPPP